MASFSLDQSVFKGKAIWRGVKGVIKGKSTYQALRDKFLKIDLNISGCVFRTSDQDNTLKSPLLIRLLSLYVGSHYENSYLEWRLHILLEPEVPMQHY